MSAFAEYAVVTAQCAIAIPEAMPLDRACLLGCDVLTGVGAATRIAQLGYGDTAMVIGCGAVGLAAVQEPIPGCCRKVERPDAAQGAGAAARLKKRKSRATEPTRGRSSAPGSRCGLQWKFGSGVGQDFRPANGPIPASGGGGLTPILRQSRQGWQCRTFF
jgi:hypothetical protein